MCMCIYMYIYIYIYLYIHISLSLYIYIKEPSSGLRSPRAAAGPAENECSLLQDAYTCANGEIIDFNNHTK